MKTRIALYLALATLLNCGYAAGTTVCEDDRDPPPEDPNSVINTQCTRTAGEPPAFLSEMYTLDVRRGNPLSALWTNVQWLKFEIEIDLSNLTMNGSEPLLLTELSRQLESATFPGPESDTGLQLWITPESDIQQGAQPDFELTMSYGVFDGSSGTWQGTFEAATIGTLSSTENNVLTISYNRRTVGSTGVIRAEIHSGPVYNAVDDTWDYTAHNEIVVSGYDLHGFLPKTFVIGMIDAPSGTSGSIHILFDEAGDLRDWND